MVTQAVQLTEIIHNAVVQSVIFFFKRVATGSPRSLISAVPNLLWNDHSEGGRSFELIILDSVH